MAKARVRAVKAAVVEAAVAGNSQPRTSARPIRRGLILILVLIVIVLLSLGAYSFTENMLAHHEAAQLSGRQVQTRALVDTGVQAARVFLSQPADLELEAGGIFNNEERFRGVTVIEDEEPELRGSFSVLAPNLDADGNLGGVRFGLEDESTRLNLNTLLAGRGAGRRNGPATADGLARHDRGRRRCDPRLARRRR